MANEQLFADGITPVAKPKSKTIPKSTSASRANPPRPIPFASPPSPIPSVQPGVVPSVTPPRPSPPSIKNFLAGDAVYQQSLRGGQRTLQDMLSDITRRRSETETTFAQSKEAMEADRERQLARLKEEFASRGLIHSGIFAGEQGRYQEDFQRQIQALEQAQIALIQDLLAQQTSANREHQLLTERAKQESIARRAARFNLT